MPTGFGRAYYQVLSLPDDPYITLYVNDLSLGMDSRSDGERLLPRGVNPGPNQSELLYNVDLSTPGKTSKRKGLLLIGNTAAICASAGIFELGNYAHTSTTASAGLLHYEDTNLRIWKDTGDWVDIKTNFSASNSAHIIGAGLNGKGDVAVIQNGIDNAFVFEADGTMTDTGNANDSPPKSVINAYIRNRLFCFGNESNADQDDWLFFSDAFPSAYSGAFDRTTNAFKVNAGEGGKGMAAVPFRMGDLGQEGLILFKDSSIWGLPLSNTDMTANEITPINLSRGLVARNGWTNVGDDIWYLSSDGVRSLVRTEQEKLKGFSFPLSYYLKSEFDTIAWANIDKACAVWWNNIYFLSLPVNGSTTNNQVWAAWPAFTYQVGTELFPAWVVFTGWNIASWQKRRVGKEERLYAGDSTTGKVYQIFGATGNDDGSAINMQIQSRTFNFDSVLQNKVPGELLIRMLSSGNHDVTASISVDDQDFTRLGIMNLNVSGANLPVTLPFDLVGQSLISKPFHLDKFGEVNRIKYKIQHNDINTGDEITLVDASLTAWPVEYQPE